MAGRAYKHVDSIRSIRASSTGSAYQWMRGLITMSADLNRRRLLAAAGCGTLAAIGDLGFLRTLEPVAAEEAKVKPEHVTFPPEIEPLVRLLEDTPRDRLLEAVAAKV